MMAGGWVGGEEGYSCFLAVSSSKSRVWTRVVVVVVVVGCCCCCCCCCCCWLLLLVVVVVVVVVVVAAAAVVVVVVAAAAVVVVVAVVAVGCGLFLMHFNRLSVRVLFPLTTRKLFARDDISGGCPPGVDRAEPGVDCGCADAPC